MAGRPKKALMEKRDKRLTINLTVGELNEIAAKARGGENKTQVSDYVRERIFGPEPVAAKTKSAPVGEIPAEQRAETETTNDSILRLVETLTTKQTGTQALAEVHERLGAIEDLLAEIARSQAQIIENQKQTARRY